MKVDMHMHTTCSDGSLTPDDLVQYAVEQELRLIAITDHHSVEGLLSLKDSYPDKLQILPGIEINTSNHRELHILGYGLDIRSSVLHRFLSKLSHSSLRANMKLQECLRQQGISLDVSGYKGQAAFRRNLAYALMEQGLCSSREEANVLYLDYRQHHITPPYKPTAQESIQIIRDAGGIAVLAHPGRLERHEINIVEVVEELIFYGLEGLECYHPSHSSEQQQRYVTLASEKGLYRSGGSDFHHKEHTDTGIKSSSQTWWLDSSKINILDAL